MRHTLPLKRSTRHLAAALLLSIGLCACDQPASQPVRAPNEPNLENPKSRAGQLIKDARDARKQAESRGQQVKEDLNTQQ